MPETLTYNNLIRKTQPLGPPKWVSKLTRVKIIIFPKIKSNSDYQIPIWKKKRQRKKIKNMQLQKLGLVLLQLQPNAKEETGYAPHILPHSTETVQQ